jgi:hypothetical protein
MKNNPANSRSRNLLDSKACQAATIKQKKHTAATKNARKEKFMGQFLQWLWDHCFKNKAPVWQAICAVILSVFTILLYRVSDRATETSRASERAFLNFSQLGLGVQLNTPNSKDWAGQEFSLNWINSGNTPASDVFIQANAQAWRSDLPLDYDFPENKENTLGVIGPKSSYGTLAHVSKVDLMDAWIANSRIFFWGSVVYKDIFPDDPSRLSEFCVEMTHVTFAAAPPSGAPPVANKAAPKKSSTPPSIPPANTEPTALPAVVGGVIGFQWQACREHNCYDQGCKDYSQRVKDAYGK